MPLFDYRGGRSVRLNRYGAAYRRHVERALAGFDLARRELAEITSPVSGTVTLAFGSPLGTWLVPQMLAAYREIRPQSVVNCARVRRAPCVLGSQAATWT